MNDQQAASTSAGSLARERRFPAAVDDARVLGVAGLPAVFCFALSLTSACSKSDRDRAIAIVDDASLSTKEALELGMREIWRDRAGTRTSVSAMEGPVGAWRVIVVVDRPEQPAVEQRGTLTVLRFYRYLDGESVGRMMSTMSVGHARNVTEVLVAERYRAVLDGQTIITVAPMRTVYASAGMQTFKAWPSIDMKLLEPYDLLMDETATAVMPSAHSKADRP